MTAGVCDFLFAHCGFQPLCYSFNPLRSVKMEKAGRVVVGGFAFELDSFIPMHSKHAFYISIP